MRNLLLLVTFFVFYACNNSAIVQEPTLLHNPILPGYFADPSLIQDNGKFYLYVTSDPWGKESLACWESEDFVNWTFHQLNWPTKTACTSALSNENQVWAPSVIKKGENYYMYVSVGSEVWCGTAKHPLGPWANVLVDKPMLPFDTTKYCHVIDAEAFTDDDGRSYLYWGSGWDWMNGRCFVAELDESMAAFKDEPKEITPTNYFEGPFMLKHQSKYYLTYSDGKTIEDTYKVRYAVGNSPYGPFVEAANSPILSTDTIKKVYGPGHHAVANIGGQHYILYHKHRLPYIKGTAYRQLCIDSLNFDAAHAEIAKVYPSDAITIPNIGKKSAKSELPIQSVKVSSIRDSYCEATNLTDNNFQTLWAPASDDTSPSILIELPMQEKISELILLFEYPWKKHNFSCEVSTNNVIWEVIHTSKPDCEVGSPYVIPLQSITNSRYIRLQVDKETALWEIKLYK